MKRSENNFTPAVIRELRAWSNGYCMICGKSCIGNKQGQAAHIIPASEFGPRYEYRETVSRDFISSAENGLWVCPNCHVKIDAPNTVFTYDDLVGKNKSFKDLYELRGSFQTDIHIECGCFERIAKAILDSTGILSGEIHDSTTLRRVDLHQKNEANNLTPYQKNKIENFFTGQFNPIHQAIIRADLSVETTYLSSAIKALYFKLSEQLNTQSEIFDNMIKVMKSAVAQCCVDEYDILSYYYVMCEVFRKQYHDSIE